MWQAADANVYALHLAQLTKCAAGTAKKKAERDREREREKRMETRVSGREREIKTNSNYETQLNCAAHLTTAA